MASTRDSGLLLERSSHNNDSSDDKNHGRSLIKERDHTAKESSIVSKQSNENANDGQSGFSKQLSDEGRSARKYHINNDQTELIIRQGDITKIEVDAIVNVTNEAMTGDTKVNKAIHEAAGTDLSKACALHKEISPGVRLPIGFSRIFLSHNMKPDIHYIINTAAPIYNDGAVQKWTDNLSSCYKTALTLAKLYDLESISFTAIGCDTFDHTANDAAKVALETVAKEAGIIRTVVFVLPNNDIYNAWVKKAQELEFTSLDNDSSTALSHSKQLSEDNTQPSTQNPGNNSDDQTSSKQFDLNVIDGSSKETTTAEDKSEQKSVENNNDDGTSKPETVSNEKSHSIVTDVSENHN